MKYTASDGSLWHVEYEHPPIPDRNHDWSWVSNDYGGPGEEDYPGDDRHGTAPTKEAAIAAVEEWVAEYGEVAVERDGVYGCSDGHRLVSYGGDGRQECPMCVVRAEIERVDLLHRDAIGRVQRDRDVLHARLEEESARLDYLESEMACEQQEVRLGLKPAPSLFRNNLPITREAIDEAREARAFLAREADGAGRATP